MGGEQRYRVFWVWSCYVVQVHVGDDPAWHTGRLPGNPFWWLLYVAALCALGVVVAVIHDPGSDRVRLGRVALGLVVAAAVLGVLSLTLGFTDGVVSPGVCGFC